jgi:hypothetical protein
MKPPYHVLRENYPRKDSRELLFADIGWSDLTNNPAYWDTCAIRMSTALLRTGVTLPGARMQAHAGTINLGETRDLPERGGRTRGNRAA